MKIKKILDTLSKTKYLITKLLSQKNGIRYISLKTVRLLSGALIGVIGIIVPGLIINELMSGIQGGEWNISVLTVYLALLLVVPLLYQILLIPLDNLLFRAGGELTISLHERIDCYYPGTGDVFAAVMLGALLGGAKLRDACVKAGEFVRDTIAYTAQQGTDPNFGVQFEKLLPYLWQK